MNLAPFVIAAFMKALKILLLRTTSGRRASTGLICGFLQEKFSSFFRIFEISHQSIMSFPSLRFMIVSMMRWVVMTFPQRCWRASFTSPILNSHKLFLISSFSSRALYLSSLPFTYWETRELSFSGRIQNILPICFGLSFSSYRRWRMSQTLARKFLAS